MKNGGPLWSLMFLLGVPFAVKLAHVTWAHVALIVLLLAVASVVTLFGVRWFDSRWPMPVVELDEDGEPIEV